MQHIVEVAFDFNDKAIAGYIESQLEKDVRDSVVAKAWGKFKNSVPSRTYDSDRDFMDFMTDAVYKRFMEEHESELVRLAAMTLAMRADLRRAWKEALADAEAELSGKEDGNEHD